MALLCVSQLGEFKDNSEKPGLDLGSWAGFAARANLEKPVLDLGSWAALAARASFPYSRRRRV
jgi:predicted nicotinamide N-methyase